MSEHNTTEFAERNSAPKATLETFALPDYEAMLLDVIAAFRERSGQQDRRIYRLETQISRYDRVFEKMFQEELENRTRQPKDHGSDTCVMPDPLGRMTEKIHKSREARRETR